MNLPPVTTISTLFLISLVLQLGCAVFMQHNIWFGVAAVQLGAFLLPMLVVLRMQRLDWRMLFAWRPQQVGAPTTVSVAGYNVVPLVLLLGLTIVIATVCEQLVEWSQTYLHSPPLFEDTHPEIIQFASWSGAVLRITMLALLPAIVEELYFRGFCQTGLVHHYGRARGVALAAFMFALAHHNLAYLHLYFALGLYLGWVRLRYQSVALAMFAHFINNAWTLVLKNTPTFF